MMAVFRILIAYCPFIVLSGRDGRDRGSLHSFGRLIWG